MSQTPKIATLVTTLVASLWLARCTGQEGAASESYVEPKPPVQQPATPPPPPVDAAADIHAISQAIPIYEGAVYREDLTRRDETMYKNQYGRGTAVYTLATSDSFPQVWHYYVTYLAQFRAFTAQPPYPPENQTWRTLEIPLNQVMQDPFIPGDSLQATDKVVILQIAETEAEPATVIRYIVRPAGGPAPADRIAESGQKRSGPTTTPSQPDEEGSDPGASDANLH